MKQRKILTILEFKSSLIQDEAGVSKGVQTVMASSKDQPLVVVAGMGKTEERLLEAGEKSADQDLVLASTLAEGARTFHMQVARQLTSNQVWTETQNFLSELYEEFSDLLQGLYLIGELGPQGKRILSSYAERASVLIFAQALKEKGVQAQPVCGRQVYLANSAHISKSFHEKAVADFRQEISFLSKSETIPVISSSLRSIAAEG
ncbi:MAG: hypothetical protein ACE5MK_02360 [Acidobacteriota bacterium]